MITLEYVYDYDTSEIKTSVLITKGNFCSTHIGLHKDSMTKMMIRGDLLCKGEQSTI